jgi:hypothetical protein
MRDRRIITPANVPTSLVDAAELTVNAIITEDPASEPALRDAIRAMLAIVLPMYEQRLGAELGRLTVPCRVHDARSFAPDCVACQRYSALLGARRLIESCDGYAGILRHTPPPEVGDDTG